MFQPTLNPLFNTIFGGFNPSKYIIQIVNLVNSGLFFNYLAKLQVLDAIQKVVNMHPMSVTMDFEKAMWNAVASIFPEASIHGCTFHWCQVHVFFFIVINPGKCLVQSDKK